MPVNKKYFSIIITSNFSEKVRSYRLSLIKAKILLFIGILLCCGAIGLIFIYGSIGHKNLKIMMLTEENERLKNKVGKIIEYEEEFNKLNKNVIKLANMLGVSKIGDIDDIEVKFNPQKKPSFEVLSKIKHSLPYFYPVKGVITQKFSDHHKGIDISANYGDSVISTIDGIVKFAGYDPILGNVIRISNKEGITTVYGHLAKIIVKKGKKVYQGELIGFVGSTGKSNAPHLHYEIWEKGVPQNPEKYLEIADK